MTRKLMAVVLLAVLLAGSVFAGRYTMQDDLKAQENKTQASERKAKDLREKLDAAENQVDNLESEIAACDVEAANDVFGDVLASYSELLAQYDAYLDNDELVFYIDWDQLDSVTGGGYDARDSMASQFEEAIASCLDSSSSSAENT